MPKKTRSRRANITIDETTFLPEILEKLKQLTTEEVQVGVEGDEDLAMIAAIHEFGSIKAQIPPRSFIGSGRKKSSAAVSKLAKKGLQDVVEGGLQPKSLLKELGETAKNRTLKNFDKIRTPPLSPLYAKRKGNDKILVQEAQLRDSLTYIIVPRRSRR